MEFRLAQRYTFLEYVPISATAMKRCKSAPELALPMETQLQSLYSVRLVSEKSGTKGLKRDLWWLNR